MRRLHAGRTWMILALGFLAAGAGACASSGAGPSRGGSRNVISAEQLAELEPMSALDAIQRLRPHWVRQRGATSTHGTPGLILVMDGVVHADLSALVSVNSRDLQEIRYLNRRDATTRYGTIGAGGAIILTTLPR